MYVSKSLYAYNFFPILIKPLIATAAMLAFIVYAGVLRLFFIIPLSALVYLASIFLLRTFDDDDYNILRKIFKKPGHNAS